MKKVLFLLAVAGMFSFAACNNNAEATAEEPAVEEMIEEAPVEEVADSAAVEAVAEEVATEAVAQ